MMGLSKHIKTALNKKKLGLYPSSDGSPSKTVVTSTVTGESVTLDGVTPVEMNSPGPYEITIEPRVGNSGTINMENDIDREGGS